MRLRIVFATILSCLLAAPLLTANENKPKLRPTDEMEIIRGLSSEYATAKMLLPRSKKPLRIEPGGEFDEEQWQEAEFKNGPAARVGDLVQITKVRVGKKEIEFELNGGWRTGPKWYERIQVAGGSSVSAPLATGAQPTLGTRFALVFPDGVPRTDSAGIKELLKPMLDFERRSATEQYIDTLPVEIQQAIKEERAVEGMDKEAVLVALGKPKNKIREEKEGEEFEDWIYGEPPGKMTFITFNGENKVVKVKETYAGFGTTLPDLPVPR